MANRTALRRFRGNLLLTQGEMSDQLKCSRSLYALIERGQRDGSMKFWQSFQTAFDVPDADMWQLMKGE